MCLYSKLKVSCEDQMILFYVMMCKSLEWKYALSVSKLREKICTKFEMCINILLKRTEKELIINCGSDNRTRLSWSMFGLQRLFFIYWAHLLGCDDPMLSAFNFLLSLQLCLTFRHLVCDSSSRTSNMWASAPCRWKLFFSFFFLYFSRQPIILHVTHPSNKL